jgi:putative lipoprotein
MAVIEGEVFYRERRLLPPGAELRVTLEDVSRMDVTSTVIAESTQMLTGAPPYSFALPYPPERIEARMQYSLRATIRVHDRLLFTSTERLDPFRDPGARLSILLNAAGAHAAPEAPRDAAHQPDTALAVVSVNPLAELTNTYWKLISLKGEDVVMTPRQSKEAFLQLRSHEGVLRGFGGCNSFKGKYTFEGNSIRFDSIATTRMACIDAMETEAGFMAALEATVHYSIHEEMLILLDAEKRPIAHFAAVYFD